MKKNIILGLISFLLLQTTVFANAIDKTIAKSDISKANVSVSVKDVKTGKTVYKLNEKRSQIPASTLKLITLSASLDTLGYDYEFTTEMFKSTNNELFIKLGGDPFLTYGDLRGLFNTARDKKILEPKAIYLDDYVFDDVEWGEGWQWDDDLNPLMPKISSYNLDGNLLHIVINPTYKNAPAQIYPSRFYPVTFMNLVTSGGSANSVKLSRNNSIAPDLITAEGSVSHQVIKKIPVNNPKRYFVLRCEDAVKSAKIYYYGKYLQKKTPSSNIYSVDKVTHPIDTAINAILKQSNNLVAESVFKAAGGKFVQNTGSLGHSQQMLNAYFDKLGLNYDDIRIVDGSGVSKNNIITADFMSEFLVKIADNEEFVNSMATAGEGTLTTRMLYFRDNLRAKTGTLSDVSTIAGYITSRNGKRYAFDIMINDPKSKSADKKVLEEYILRDIYTNF